MFLKNEENIINKIQKIIYKYEKDIETYDSKILNIKTEKEVDEFIKNYGPIKTKSVEEILSSISFKNISKTEIEDIEKILKEFLTKFHTVNLKFYEITDQLDFNKILDKRAKKAGGDMAFKEYILPEHKKLFNISKKFNQKFNQISEKTSFTEEEFLLLEKFLNKHQEQLINMKNSNLIVSSYNHLKEILNYAIINDFTYFKLFFYADFYSNKLEGNHNVKSKQEKENKYKINITPKEIETMNKDFSTKFSKLKNDFNKKDIKIISTLIEEINSIIENKEMFLTKSNLKKLEEFKEYENKLIVETEIINKKENNDNKNIVNTNLSKENLSIKNTYQEKDFLDYYNEFSVKNLEIFYQNKIKTYKDFSKNINDYKLQEDFNISEEILLWIKNLKKRGEDYHNIFISFLLKSNSNIISPYLNPKEEIKAYEINKSICLEYTKKIDELKKYINDFEINQNNYNIYKNIVETTLKIDLMNNINESVFIHEEIEISNIKDIQIQIKENIEKLEKLKKEITLNYISTIVIKELKSNKIEITKSIEKEMKKDIEDFNRTSKNTINQIEKILNDKNKFLSIILRYEEKLNDLSKSEITNNELNISEKLFKDFEVFIKQNYKTLQFNNISPENLFDFIKEKQEILKIKEQEFKNNKEDNPLNESVLEHKKLILNIDKTKIEQYQENEEQNNKSELSQQLLFKENNKKMVKEDLITLKIYKEQYQELESGITEIKKQFNIIFNEEIENIEKVKTFEINFENLKIELLSLLEQINNENFYSDKIKNIISETAKHKYNNLLKEINKLEEEYELLYELAKEEYEQKLYQMEQQKELEKLAFENITESIKEEIDSTIKSNLKTNNKIIEELREKVETNEVIIKYTANNKIIEELVELNTNNKEGFNKLYKIIDENNIFSIKEFNDKYEDDLEIQKELEKNKENILNSLFYFKDGQINKTYSIDYINEQIIGKEESTGGNTTELINKLNLPLNNYSLQFEKTINFIDFNIEEGKIINKKIDEIFISIDDKTKSINFTVYFDDKTKLNFQNIDIKNINNEMKNNLINKLENRKMSYNENIYNNLIIDLKSIFNIKGDFTFDKIKAKNNIKINEDLNTLIFNSIIELNNEKELLLFNKQKEISEISNINNHQLIERNNLKNQKKDIDEVYKKIKKICKYIIPVKGHYKTVAYGKNRHKRSIQWINPFYKNKNDLINAKFEEKELRDAETYKTPILSENVSEKNQINIIEENELAKNNNNEEKAHKQAERLVLKIIEYFQPNGEYNKKKNSKFNINEVKEKIKNIDLNIFVVEELKEYLVNNLEKKEKNQKLIIEDSLNLITYINNKFPNNFKIENLNNGKNEKGYDYQAFDANEESNIKNQKYTEKNLLSISYKFNDGRSWYNPSMEAFINIALKKDNKLAEILKNEMDEMTRQIDKKIKRYTNIDNIIVNIYKSFKEELPEDYTEKDIRVAFDNIQKMDKPDFINFKYENIEENIPITKKIKDKKIYSDFYDKTVFKIIEKILNNKTKNNDVDSFKNYIKDLNYLTQSSIVSDDLVETKYIIKDLYTNTEFNKQWKKIFNQGKTIGEEYHDKLNNVISKIILKQYEIINDDVKLKENILINILHLKDGENIIVGKNKIIELPNKELILKHIKNIKIIIEKDSFQPTNSGVEFNMKVLLDDKELFVFNKNTIKSKNGSMRGTLSVDMSSTKDMVMIENINEVLLNYKSVLNYDKNIEIN